MDDEPFTTAKVCYGNIIDRLMLMANVKGRFKFTITQADRK